MRRILLTKTGRKIGRNQAPLDCVLARKSGKDAFVKLTD
jgi:hypothetical protein